MTKKTIVKLSIFIFGFGMFCHTTAQLGNTAEQKEFLLKAVQLAGWYGVMGFSLVTLLWRRR